MAHREARPHTRARLSDAAPAASDKHRLLIGSREGLSRVRIVARSLSEVVFATSHPQPCRIGKPARIPGRAYRTPRQRLRISTASYRNRGSIPIGSRLRDFASAAMSHREARPHTGARLSDAAPAASDKHRLLHRKSRRAVPGPDRGSIPIGSRLRDFQISPPDQGALMLMFGCGE